MPTIVKASDTNCKRAAQMLREGYVVAFPTETVYGLGGDTFNTTALRRVYEMKSRPADNPLIAHVINAEEASTLTDHWDKRCQHLTEQFWPGPLTLIVSKATVVPDEATAGYPTIAIRSPAHAVARALLSRFGGPISAPSANRSGHVSPTSALHVADDFFETEDFLILDGGPCDLGIESTVVDMTAKIPRVLRPGNVSVDQLCEALGARVELATEHRQSISPGTSRSHYAPRTEVVLISTDDLPTTLTTAHSRCVVLAVSAIDITSPHDFIAMPKDGEAYAARLYDALRQADALQAERIIIERPKLRSGVWEAIGNRLARASAR